MSQNEDIREMIQRLSEAPDSHLHGSLAEDCKEFLDGGTPFEDPILFLADLRDQAVHCGGASRFIMSVFRILIEENGHPWEDVKKRLENHPESHRSPQED